MLSLNIYLHQLQSASKLAFLRRFILHVPCHNVNVKGNSSKVLVRHFSLLEYSVFLCKCQTLKF